MIALLFMFLNLALLVGIAWFAAVKTVKALNTGKIYFGPKESPDWRDIYRAQEPYRFWEAIVMHVLLGALGFGGTAWMLINLPATICTLVQFAD